MMEDYLAPADVPRYVRGALQRLRDLHLVQSQGLLSSAGEFVWVITPRGTRAFDYAVHYGESRYTFPTWEMLARKLLSVQVRAVLRGYQWEYLCPVVYNPRHPKPDDTPQRLALQHALTLRRAQPPPGQPPTLIHPQYVPNGLNDWVIWPPHRPDLARVLVLHPLEANRHFWDRPAPPARPRRPGTRRAPIGRLGLYKILRDSLPLLGVFDTRPHATNYAALLPAGGFQALDIVQFSHVLPTWAP